MAALRLPRRALSPGEVVELLGEVRTSPITGFPSGARGRVVGAGERPGEVTVELLGTGNVPIAFSVAGSGVRASVPREGLRRIYPPSPWWRRAFD